MAVLVSQREFSRRAGVTLRTVQQAIERGAVKIHHTEKAGSKTRVFIDWEIQGKAYAAARLPGANHATRGEQNSVPRGPMPGPGEGAAPPGEPSAYSKARTAREVFNAKFAEIRYKSESKAVVPTEKIKVLFFEIGRTIQLNMLNIPARIAPIIAAEHDEKKVYEILTSEIIQSLEALANNGKFDSLFK